VIYFFMIKPARKRQQEAVQTQSSLRPGSEVRTIAGLFATVTEVEDDSVILEIAPGVHSRYLKSAIAAVLSTGDEDDDIAGDDHEGAPADAVDADKESGDDGDDTVDLDKKPGDDGDGTDADKPADGATDGAANGGKPGAKDD
jgi:preprotein translocase subunit YajC